MSNVIHSNHDVGHVHFMLQASFQHNNVTQRACGCCLSSVKQMGISSNVLAAAASIVWRSRSTTVLLATIASDHT
jgi:hypothetical protein